MNERCDRCGHSPASHELWGSGPCEARNCTCGKFIAPSPWAADAARHQAQRRLEAKRITCPGCREAALRRIDAGS